MVECRRLGGRPQWSTTNRSRVASTDWRVFQSVESLTCFCSASSAKTWHPALLVFAMVAAPAWADDPVNDPVDPPDGGDGGGQYTGPGPWWCNTRCSSSLGCTPLGPGKCQGWCGANKGIWTCPASTCVCTPLNPTSVGCPNCS